MDLTKPIDITAVNNTRIKYNNVLVALNMLSAAEVLGLATPITGVQSSVLVGKTKHGAITAKYTGTFKGDKSMGAVEPRTLTVYPIVAEMADEPERYRRSFIADVAGGLWDKKHPFELWLLQFGVNMASEELHNVLFTAKRDEAAEKLGLEDSFDGWFTIIDKDIADGKISVAKKNQFSTGAMTELNSGDVLLEMWRSLHPTLKRKNVNMIISHELGELYDDWYKTEHDNPPGVDQAGQMFLEGTNRKCRLVRTTGYPAGSQRVIITTKPNMLYGTDKLADMKNMKAFNSGNPYLFTAAMKYVLGTQFLSINEREFVVNDQPGVPATSGSV